MQKINSFRDLKFFVKKDLLAKGEKLIIKKFITSPVIRFTVLLRINEYLNNSNILFRIIPLIWFKRLSIKLGFSIPLNVIDYGLSIVHYGLIIISPDAEIGKNCRIHAGVNIGGSAGFKAKGDNKKYAPKIGNNCYIGPGAKLFGAIIIGDNNVIGANAVVNKNFKNNNITIGGIPAKKISDKGSEGLVYKI